MFRTNTDSPAETTQKPRKSRKGCWLSLLLLLLLSGGGAYGYLNYTPHGRDTAEMLNMVRHMAVTAKTQPNLIFDNVNSDHVNLLLIGRDVNYKQVYDKHGRNIMHAVDEKTPARSDTMIVVTLDKTRKVIRMISLPRDAIVRLPRNEYHVRRAKLNAAHAYGGPQLLIQTLHDELGLTIHRHAVIRFEGFKKLIDQMGGIEVNVEGALKKDHKTGKLYRGNLDYDDNWGNLHIHLKPGLQTLTGEQAHNYVRFRMDLEGDPGRIRRQQSVMRALAKQMMGASFTQLPGLIKEARRQFETDLTDDEIGSMAQFAKSIGNAAKIQPLTLFGSFGRRGSLYLNKPKNEKLLAYIFGPTFNPDNFLQRSPWTERDDLGPTNDAKPEAVEILRAAGVIEPGEELEKGFGVDAPVVDEPQKEPTKAEE